MSTDPSFDQDSGVKSFPEGTQKSVTINGAYHGVVGTYSCTPTDDTVCAVSKVTDGFALGLRVLANNVFTLGPTGWSFRPNNPNSKVTSAGGDALASFGWWVHQPSEDEEWSAGVFTQDRGAPTTPDGLTAGLTASEAKYEGNAVGKYTLYSTTGGINDAGHFVADANLTATWGTADTLKGTINNFKGSDNKARNWEVTLKSSNLSPSLTSCAKKL